MHPLFHKADELSSSIISAAIEVHKALGPGLLESIYEKCLAHELKLQNTPTIQQQPVTIESFTEELRLDLICDNCLIIEIKAIADALPIHKAQLLSYMKLLNIPIGLLINFHAETLTKGLDRMILPNANVA